MTSSFYTSIHRLGSSILYRGYNQAGTRVQKKDKFSPTLFVPSDQPSEWKALDGRSVRPVKFDSMTDARDFAKQVSGVDNYEVHGMQNYVFQYITDRFPGTISYDYDRINCCMIDIEVFSGDGMPNVERADKEVTSIAMRASVDRTWRVFGLKEYDVSKSVILEKYPDANIQYVRASSEAELLEKFLTCWSKEDYCPDVVSGWYIRFFDVPYLVNRITRVLGEDEAKKLSPWRHIDRRTVAFKGGKESVSYDLAGIQVLDYMDLFQKFGVYAFGPQESYKLDHIAHVVLGERKLSYEEYGSLHNLYAENHQLFIDYNLRDIGLVWEIEQEIGLINLVFTVAYKAGVNYLDALGTTAIWDSIIYRELNKRKIAVPPSRPSMKTSYVGGYVKEVRPGRYDWVVSFDLDSLYPNEIVQYNMSPEMLRREPGHRSDVEYWMNQLDPVESDYAVAANGAVFSRERQGIIPEIIVKYYDERKVIKAQMLKDKQRYEETKDDEIKSAVSRGKTSEHAIKILLNSLYGAYANVYFRYYAIEIAEAITMSGQLSIKWAERALNDEVNRLMKTSDVDYVIAVDTDSVYIDFGPLIKRVTPSNPVKFLDKVCSEHFMGVIDSAYERLAKKQNAFMNRMKMKREVIADRGIWTAKKRYILNVHNSEGVQYAEPELKIMGIEAIKSSTPEVCRDKMKAAFKVMIEGSESDFREFVRAFKSEFSTLSADMVAAPRGVSEVAGYENGNDGIKKGAPINSKAAIYYNRAIRRLGLEGKYDLITNGSKMKYVFLKQPNPARTPIMGFTSYLPKELNLDKYVDYDTQFDKVFLDPISIVMSAIGWTMKEQNSLDEFFG